MALNGTQGQLVIIGGAEDKEGECRILREFVRRAGGTKARIVVMTVATELPREVGENYVIQLQARGSGGAKEYERVCEGTRIGYLKRKKRRRRRP